MNKFLLLVVVALIAFTVYSDVLGSNNVKVLVERTGDWSKVEAPEIVVRETAHVGRARFVVTAAKVADVPGNPYIDVVVVYKGPYRTYTATLADGTVLPVTTLVDVMCPGCAGVSTFWIDPVQTTWPEDGALSIKITASDGTSFNVSIPNSYFRAVVAR